MGRIGIIEILMGAKNDRGTQEFQDRIKALLNEMGEGEKCYTCEKANCPMYPLAQLVTKDKPKERETLATLTEEEVKRFKALGGMVEEHEVLVAKLRELDEHIEVETKSMWLDLRKAHGITEGDLHIHEDGDTLTIQKF